MSSTLHLLKFGGGRKISPILQTEAAECGLASLAMVSNFHGHDIDLNGLRQQYSISLKGATLQDIINLADKLQFTTRALRLELEELSQLQTPCILHWDLNHFVVLEKVNNKQITILDPAVGRRTYSFAEVSPHFTGVALELTPTKGFKPFENRTRLKLSDFWTDISGLKRALVQLFVLSLMLQLFAIVAPFYTQLVVDDVVISQDMDLLVILAIGFGLLVVIRTITYALRALVLLVMGSQLSIQIGANLFRHLLRLPIEYFQKRHIGDIVSRFGSLEEIKKLLTSGVVEAVVDGIMVIGTIIMMLIYSPKLTLVVVVAVLIYAIIRMTLFPLMKQRTEETIVTSAKQNSNTIESIRAIQSIKLFGAENFRQTLWQNRYADTINSSIKLGKLSIGFDTINNLLFGLENVIVVYFAASIIVDGQFSVGMLFAFMSYKQQFTTKASSFIEKMIQYRMLSLHLQRLGDIALTEQENFQEENTESRKFSLKGKIELRDVGFRYSENEPFLFRHFNMTVEPGESVALTGPSGVGKSTLMKIILGLIEPVEGEVLIDDRPMSKWDKRYLRSLYGTVMQDDSLLSGSFSDNISFFSENPDEQRISLCAQAAGLYDDIVKMPMGFNTLVGDMGTTMSGGQQQRLLLARAFYRNPKILLLDEATSHLDEKLEKFISANIKSMNITRLFIAHRSETIASADRVVVIDMAK